MSVFEIRDLTYGYNARQDRPSLDHVSLSIAEGRRTVILGANGAGKSTLFYHLNGVLKPKEGTVMYNGTPIDYSKESLRELRSDVCLVVQNPDEQIFSSTVEEDVAFGPMNMGLDHDEVDRRVEDALKMVGMESYRSRPSTQLSYGQRKRISLAGALAVGPKVLILDEPTAGLDPQMSKEVMELIDQLCCAGTTVLISTHDVDLAYGWAEDAIVLEEGHLIYSGAPEGFFSDHAKVASAGLCAPHSFSLNSILSRAGGRSEAPYPKTNSQLLAKMAPEGGQAGSVRLVPLNGAEDIIDTDGKHSGAYGFSAKKILAEADVSVEFPFDALELCLLCAVRGEESVLFCDPSMTGMAEERIRSLGRFGMRPEVII